MRHRLPRVARECWTVAAVAAAVVLAVVVSHWQSVYRPSDAPQFLGVAQNPFGNGAHYAGQALVQGVAYRYGRIGFPIVAWVLALGRPAAARGTLAAVFVASFGAWVALAAEHLRRGGRRPRLALWILALPWMLLWFAVPEIVSEPMAAALMLFAYLCEREGRGRPARFAAALAILTREQMIVAFIPLAWRDWKRRRWAAVRSWSLVLLPYAAWTVWVRVRIGHFPLTDPASTRRDAFALPFVAWYRTLTGPLAASQKWSVLVAFATVALVALLVIQGKWLYPITHGAVALAALSLCYGANVLRYPGEAFRILAPVQVLLVIAACSRRDSSSSDADADQPADAKVSANAPGF